MLVRGSYIYIFSDNMGKAQSKDSKDETDRARADKKELVEVEEVFVQKIAYKCGVTEEELSAKKEVFQQHAGGDPTIGFEEFKNMYRDISGRKEDAFLNAYVDSIFRLGSGELSEERCAKYSHLPGLLMRTRMTY